MTVMTVEGHPDSAEWFWRQVARPGIGILQSPRLLGIVSSVHTGDARRSHLDPEWHLRTHTTPGLDVTALHAQLTGTEPRGLRRILARLRRKARP